MDQARAALTLAVLLLAFALPAPPLRLASCQHPAELEAQESVTRVVSCDRGAASAPLRGPARLLFGQRIDANRASARTLEVLPGIGPARAAAIVAARSLRPFEHLSDLERIHGIGPRTVEGLVLTLQVEPEARSAARLAPKGVDSPSGLGP